jgi:transcriptional regulator with XRE-family HTH domain
MANTQPGFSKRLREWREATGEPRRAIAQAIAVTEQTLINWERGTEPGAAAVARLARYSGRTADWWLGLSDDPRSTRRKDM